MSNSIWTTNKIEKFIKQGRGSGTLESYKPWLTIQDVPSIGRVSRENGITVDRVYHLMSDLELNYFLILDWSDLVMDIREQFPILEVEKVQDIAFQKGINYPTNKENGTPYVITSDFFITVKRGGERLNIIRTVKPSKELNKKRVIEKLEIERAYYEEKGIDWGIITEKELPNIFIRNLKWVRTAFNLEVVGSLGISDLKALSIMLKDQILKGIGDVEEISYYCSDMYNIQKEIFIYLFRHLLATKQIRTDFSFEITTKRKCADFWV